MHMRRRFSSKPFVDLSKPKGLSKEQVDALRKMLRAQAEENEGDLQIISLAETVKNYLADLAPLPAGSLHEHMMANAEKTEAEKKVWESMQIYGACCLHLSGELSSVALSGSIKYRFLLHLFCFSASDWTRRRRISKRSMKK